MSSCPYQNISQIGSYLIDVRRQNELQLLLDNYNGWNLTVRHGIFNTRFPFRPATNEELNQIILEPLTRQELINKARTVSRNLTQITTTRHEEYFRLLMVQFLSVWARERGMAEEAQHWPYMMALKEKIVNVLVRIVESI